MTRRRWRIFARLRQTSRFMVSCVGIFFFFLALSPVYRFIYFIPFLCFLCRVKRRLRLRCLYFPLFILSAVALLSALSVLTTSHKLWVSTQRCSSRLPARWSHRDRNGMITLLSFHSSTWCLFMPGLCVSVCVCVIANISFSKSPLLFPLCQTCNFLIAARRHGGPNPFPGFRTPTEDQNGHQSVQSNAVE